MTVTVSVDASWRMSRFEFTMPYSSTGMVYGYSEVLLQATDEPAKELSSVRLPPPKEGEKATYGALPGGQIVRVIEDVASDTVEVNGTSYTFEDVMTACNAFFEKWRVEDETKPPPTLMVSPPTEVSPPAESTEEETPPE
jgi:hypothetical protein